MDAEFLASLNDGKHIFVFGSNLAGRHGKGAALTAKRHWRARDGLGVGRTGDAYAIPTKSKTLGVLPLEEIETHVDNFLAYARTHRDLIFLVTAIGTGLAHYTHEQIAPLFQDAIQMPNVILPHSFLNILKRRNA